MFKSKTDNKKINDAILMANNLFIDKTFKDAIRNKASFDMATCIPSYIAGMIEHTKSSLETEVKTYHKVWSRALAYYDRKYPKTIFINTAKLKRSKGSIVATLWHERIHQIDHYDKAHYFGHGDNKRKGKLNTAPYWIDNLAQSIVDGAANFTNTESRNIKTKNCLGF